MRHQLNPLKAVKKKLKPLKYNELERKPLINTIDDDVEHHDGQREIGKQSTRKTNLIGEREREGGTLESSVKLHSIVSWGRRSRGYNQGRHLPVSKHKLARLYCERHSNAQKGG